MSFFKGHEKSRKIIPRWHTYNNTRKLGILGRVVDTTNDTNVDLTKYKEDWVNNQTPSYASELVGKSFYGQEFNDPIVIQAAQSLVQNNKSKNSARILAQNFIDLNVKIKNKSTVGESRLNLDVSSLHSKIREIKAKLQFYPNNKIWWADLSYHYSALGQLDQAKKCMKVAISGNHENRFLSLSAARCFAHIGEYDEAISVLKKGIKNHTDPWLLSGIISLSNLIGKSDFPYKQAQRILNYSNINPFHISELSASLSTLEYESGNRKKARKYVTSSLEIPTENTLAQITYLKKQYESSRFLIELNNNSFEAHARIEYENGDFNQSLKWTKHWINFQPFSSQATIHGSFIASVALENFKAAEEISRYGLISSPDDSMLLNNLIFSLINNGKLNESSRELKKLKQICKDEDFIPVVNATEGALFFKQNNIDSARVKYNSATQYFKSKKDARSEAIALYFWAKEERNLKNNTEKVRELEDRLQVLLTNSKIPEIDLKKAKGPSRGK